MLHTGQNIIWSLDYAANAIYFEYAQYLTNIKRNTNYHYNSMPNKNSRFKKPEKIMEILMNQPKFYSD